MAREVREFDTGPKEMKVSLQIENGFPILFNLVFNSSSHPCELRGPLEAGGTWGYHHTEKGQIQIKVRNKFQTLF